MSKPVSSGDMKVTIKGIVKGDDLEVELNRKLSMIDQVVEQHSTDTSMQLFKRTLGPDNAGDMEWPSFAGL